MTPPRARPPAAHAPAAAGGVAVALAVVVAGLAGCAGSPAPAAGPEALAALRTQVREAELGFARSMAQRDLAAFAAHVADDAVFVNGGQPLRGKAAVLVHWQHYFQGTTSPFSWEPALVELAAGGTLGYTEGPVRAHDGRIVGRFFSTWHRQGDGRWQVVFDNGCTAGAP